MRSTAPTPGLGDISAYREFAQDFGTAGRGATARSMRMRRLILKALAWLAGGGLIAFAAVFMFYAGMFDFSAAPPPQVAAHEPLAETLTMGELRFNGLDKKNQAYSLAAETARQDAERPNIVHLTNLRAELKLADDGGVVLVRADGGVYDTEAETILMQRNIKVVTTRGYTALLETATVGLRDGVVVSDDPVIVSTEDATLWSNGMRMWDSARHMRFTNRVRIEYENAGTSGRADAG